MDKVILKDKKKKKQPFEVENENRVNLIRNMDNHNVEEYHDYERMFHTKPYVEGVKAMDKIIIKQAQEEFKKESGNIKQAYNQFKKESRLNKKAEEEWKIVAFDETESRLEEIIDHEPTEEELTEYAMAADWDWDYMAYPVSMEPKDPEDQRYLEYAVYSLDKEEYEKE